MLLYNTLNSNFNIKNYSLKALETIPFYIFVAIIKFLICYRSNILFTFSLFSYFSEYR